MNRTVQVFSPLPAALQALAEFSRQADAPATPTRPGTAGREGVRVTLSGEGRARSDAAQEGAFALSPDDEREVAELQRRDREVRAHEAAHQAAAGSLARGGASYEYETGPDGQRYAVSGEVSIDTSAVPGDPEATVRKMEKVRAAALAPGDPSATDRKVAAQAASTMTEARAEASQESAGTPAADRAEDPGVAHRAEGAGGCPVCGGEGHGPEQHRGEIDTFA